MYIWQNQSELKCQFHSTQTRERSLEVQKKQQIIMNINKSFTKSMNRKVTKCTHKAYSQRLKIIGLNMDKKTRQFKMASFTWTCEKINSKYLPTYLQSDVPWGFKLNKKTLPFSANKPFLTVQKLKFRMNIPISL